MADFPPPQSVPGSPAVPVSAGLLAYALFAIAAVLEIAGRGFAMGQAPDAVKAVATDHLEETAATGGGIARAIAEAFGGRV